MSEPSAITQFRLMLLASATVAGASIPSARLCYPYAVTVSDDTTAVTVKPYAVLAEITSARTPFAGPGVLGLPSGTLTATFHFEDSTDGAVELFARDVCSELMTQMSGLPIRSASAELCGEATPGAMAADQTVPSAAEITATITVEWGLSG